MAILKYALVTTDRARLSKEYKDLRYPFAFNPAMMDCYKGKVYKVSQDQGIHKPDHYTIDQWHFHLVWFETNPFGIIFSHLYGDCENFTNSKDSKN